MSINYVTDSFAALQSVNEAAARLMNFAEKDGHEKGYEEGFRDGAEISQEAVDVLNAVDMLFRMTWRRDEQKDHDARMKHLKEKYEIYLEKLEENE